MEWNFELFLAPTVHYVFVLMLMRVSTCLVCEFYEMQLIYLLPKCWNWNTYISAIIIKRWSGVYVKKYSQLS